MWFQAVPPPWNRIARRSTTSAASSEGAPCTCERKPSSAYLSAREMPDFASRRFASTSWVLLPMDETMPIPVTTTRLMLASCAPKKAGVGLPQLEAGAPPSAPDRLCRLIAEQADLEVECPVDNGAIRREPAVGDAEHEFRAHHALDLDAVDDLAHGGQDLARQLQFAKAERSALPRRAEP